MKLVTFKDSDGQARLGALYDEGNRVAHLAEGYADLKGQPGSSYLESMQALIEGGEEALQMAQQALDHIVKNPRIQAWLPIESVSLLAPLPAPVQMRDFLCFREHLVNSRNVAKLMSGKKGEDDKGDISLSMLRTMEETPIYYKCNRFGVIGPDEDIVWPDYSSLMDYELEFAAIIWKEAKNTPREKARDYIFGYTIFNDMSARDFQMFEMRGILGPGKGKDFDTGTVLGPCIVTADEIDPDNLTMIAKINGQEVSRGNSGTMYHKFEDCIEHVTRCETLYPGEIIASGTVGNGSGFERFSFLAPDDVIELEVEGIGVLRNRIVAGPKRRNPKPVKQAKELVGDLPKVALEKWQYEKGLHKITDGVFAWLSPDGSWGLSNSGLVVANGKSLLIDTLYDLKLTGELLEAIKQEAPAEAESIDIVVNTHGDGDHWFGNALVEGAEIYSTTAALEQMRNLPPNMMAMMVNVVSKAPTAMGRMMKTHFSRYEFMGINPAFPNKTVDGPLTLDIGGKAVELIPVGPAHTKGDLLVYLPEDRVLFAGDIVFAQGTPIVHAGPISNCIEVLQRILDMDVDVIVPGHGPITDKRGASAMVDYLEFIRTEAGKRFDAGMGGIKAARDIDLGPFLALGDPDRIIINIIAAYNEFSNNSEEAPGIEKMWLLSEVGDY